MYTNTLSKHFLGGLSKIDLSKVTIRQNLLPESGYTHVKIGILLMVESLYTEKKITS